MINAEKHKDEILAIVNDRDYFAIDIDNTSVVRPCGGLECKNCVFNNNDYNDCNFLRMNWLLSEYKESPVKLTRLEYRILNYCLSKNYNYISRRGISNMLIVSECKLKKREYNFIESDGDWTSLCLFDDLFQFIKLGDDSTSIKEILKNSEVIEDA